VNRANAKKKERHAHAEVGRREPSRMRAGGTRVRAPRSGDSSAGTCRRSARRCCSRVRTRGPAGGLGLGNAKEKKRRDARARTSRLEVQYMESKQNSCSLGGRDRPRRGDVEGVPRLWLRCSGNARAMRAENFMWYSSSAFSSL
jgi:hypothetical protein